MIIELPINECYAAAEKYAEEHQITCIVNFDKKEVKVPKKILNSYLVSKSAKRMYDYVLENYSSFNVVPI